MGVRLTDIVFDRHEDHLYEDERAMRLTPYVMAERCTQVEVASLFKDKEEGDYTVLSEILGQGFKGYHNMDSSELIEEYKQIEELWYELESCNGLYWEPCEDDPIHKLEEEAV